MSIHRYYLFFICVFIWFACDSGASDGPWSDPDPAASKPDEPADEGEALAAELGLGPVAEGYDRYTTPAVELGMGESREWMQWLTGPLDQDYDVIDVTGEQGIGGHHALIYATNMPGEPGFTRFYEEEDQLKMRLMGGIGGEGGASVELPPGVVFRVTKGSYIVAQTHYLNYTTGPIEGRSVIDIKLAPVDESKQVAGIFSSTDLRISLEPGVEETFTVDCPVREDLHFLSISNHHARLRRDHLHRGDRARRRPLRDQA